MVITDALDASLLTANSAYASTQYLAGPSLLVAPSLSPSSSRDVYLPTTSSWYPLNLRPCTTASSSLGGVPLLPAVAGGTHLTYDCRISALPTQLPYACPTYVRSGAIIPQILVRASTPDRTFAPASSSPPSSVPSLQHQPPNPITIHVYPGPPNGEKGYTYHMYLDDGVSRASAPGATYFATLPVPVEEDAVAVGGLGRASAAYGDKEAGSEFRRVDVTQWISAAGEDGDAVGRRGRRRIEVGTGWDGYGDERVRRDVGDEYKVVVWHEEGTVMGEVSVQVEAGGCEAGRRERDEGARADVVWVPVDKEVKTTIVVTYGGSG